MRLGGVVAAALLLALPGVNAAPASVEQEQERNIVPRYLLMDTAGNPVTNRDFPGRFQLIAFGYTYCPDICPTTLGEMSVVMKQLGELASLVQPIFVTVDPERDTPAKLAEYTAFFHPTIIGLTGKPALIRRAADNFKVRYERYYEPGGDRQHYTVDHSAGMYLIGPDGHFVTKFAYATPVPQITQRLQVIIKGTMGETAKP